MPNAADPRGHSVGHTPTPVHQAPPQNMNSHNANNINSHIPPGGPNVGPVNPGSHGLGHGMQQGMPHLSVRQLAPPVGRTNLITVPIQDNHSVPPPSHNMSEMNMPQNYHYPPHGYYPPPTSSIPPPVMSSPQLNTMPPNTGPPMQMNTVQSTIGHNMSVSLPPFYGVASGPPPGPPVYPVPPVYVSQNNQMGVPSVGNMIVSNNSNQSRVYDQPYGGPPNVGGGAPQPPWPPQSSQPPPQHNYYR